MLRPDPRNIEIMEPVIEVTGLRKVFKDFWRRDKVTAVNNLNIIVYRGEVFGLLGPNASGKTTTIKLILGLLFPTSGRVRIFGSSPRDNSLKSRLGFLPEESYFYRYLNGEETMDFYGRLFRLPARVRRRRIEELLKLAGLLSARNRPVGEYSKGMARRIGLAQALINDPDLVILDEPTNGLDPIGRREMKDLIQRLKGLGKTILLSSHLLADVEDVCDRVGILYAGRLIAEGDVKELLTRKDITEILISGPSPEEVERIISAVKGVKNKKIDVTRKTETLEEFFLRTIRRLASTEEKEAHQEKEGVPGKEGESVIKRLTSTEEEPMDEKKV